MLYYEGLEEKCVDLVHKMGFDERVIYSSFSHYSVKKAMAYCYEKHYHSSFGLLTGVPIGHAPDYVKALGTDVYHPPAANLQEREIQACHALGLKVHLWTVDMKSEIKRWSDLGVDAIITDCPDSGRRVVDGDMSWWRGV